MAKCRRLGQAGALKPRQSYHSFSESTVRWIAGKNQDASHLLTSIRTSKVKPGRKCKCAILEADKPEASEEKLEVACATKDVTFGSMDKSIRVLC